MQSVAHSCGGDLTEIAAGDATVLSNRNESRRPSRPAGGLRRAAEGHKRDALLFLTNAKAAEKDAQDAGSAIAQDAAPDPGADGTRNGRRGNTGGEDSTVPPAGESPPIPTAFRPGLAARPYAGDACVIAKPAAENRPTGPDSCNQHLFTDTLFPRLYLSAEHFPLA